MTKISRATGFKCLASLLSDFVRDRRFGRCVMAYIFFPHRVEEPVGIIYVREARKGVKLIL